MNPLARSRLEAALERLDRSWNGYPELKETIRAAINHLLNPKVTSEMVAAVTDEDGNTYPAELAYITMNNELTREDA